MNSNARIGGYISRRTLMEITGLSDTTIWRLTRSGALPAPVRLSPGRVGWPGAVIDAWLATRQPTTDTQTAA